MTPFTDSTHYLDQLITIQIDRPLGGPHPELGFIYPVNYGFVPGTLSPDGDELDCYLLGVEQPCHTFTGRCIAIIRRLDDHDDKLIVVPDGMQFTDTQIYEQTGFVEAYFTSEILRQVVRD